MPKLTEMQCRKAKCETRTISKLGDGDGLYLWVYKTGIKVWHYRYKINGKQMGIHIGRYPDMSLAEARIEARDKRKLSFDGIDPAEDKRRKQLENKVSGMTFEDVAREWYGKLQPTWTMSHATDVLRRLQVNIFPTVGKRPIADIDGVEWLAAIAKIEQRGATDLARRVSSVGGQVFRYGIATGRCKFDVPSSIRGALAPHQRINQPCIPPRKLPTLMQAIMRYADDIGDHQTQLALLMLAHTFVRTNELINATWAEIDFERAVWEIPQERMKAGRGHIVPLSRQCIGYLTTLKELSRGSDLVFPGRGRLNPISSNTMIFALYRLGFKRQMTGHGFRALASTILNESGLFNSDWIERQLAHEEGNKVRGAYNRAQYLPDRTRMMQWWSDHLDQAALGS
ncbi:DUF4102 domain-containing protein [Pseudomethylobacillus aquaticus]|uniref:DUF4102 domain-containing protein n=1 Tax=Pseudomethylobacillus aquaticus TaxID=2676064 RepID=A0A3N0V5U5_9PROT|nr:integrase arm-type DNA-binding domain-containing protein [Pseudomethylobacillus aquaticus]ROH87962.1 DUF4102 domain-containing protein [Pseudomethylobacillus aquaticus]